MKKLTFLGAIGVGYVLGARAGRQRYDDIVSATKRFTGDPRVRRTASAAADYAKEQAPVVKDKVAGAASAVADKVTPDSDAEKVPDESLMNQDDPYPKGPLP